MARRPTVSGSCSAWIAITFARFEFAHFTVHIQIHRKQFNVSMYAHHEYAQVWTRLNTYEVDPDDFLTAKIVKTAEVTLPIETVPEENLDYSFESIASPRTNDTENIIEEDGIEYLAGWVARKYKRDFPDLAEVQHTHTDYNYLEMPSCLSHLSFGGLSIPSSNWLSMVRKIEKMLSLLLSKYSVFKSKNILSSRLSRMIFRRLHCQNQAMQKVVKTYIH
ncbi:unnamed protein product [Macrosiphum euphorbiae]|uniref:Transposable element P transposase-like C-terminal domain-containing protein n=1 Tax=Macrosiphum euphorbiae TaxID=13131 RepID=A0AAV0XX68_9HEMI|nr:unnamed protein product [Macrosiphum euphorbiae]